MSKVTAPLLSFGAAGQVAKTMVYSKWKGRPYARRYVIPSNPNSDGQKLTRAVFAYMFGLYRYATAGVALAMAAAAKAAQLTPANAFIKANLHTIVNAVTNDDLILSPGAGGAPATPDATPTPSSTSISFSCPAPVLPNGWTAVPKMYVAVVKEWTGADYSDVGTDFQMIEANDDTPTTGVYTVVVSGLVTATKYTCCAFYSVVRPDLTTAWGTSWVGTVTTT